MANIKSQKKRIITAEKARQRNRAVRSELKTAVKKVRAAVEAKDVEAAQDAANKAGRLLDKAASKGIIHKNQAAQRKSGVQKLVNTLKELLPHRSRERTRGAARVRFFRAERACGRRSFSPAPARDVPARRAELRARRRPQPRFRRSRGPSGTGAPSCLRRQQGVTVREDTWGHSSPIMQALPHPTNVIPHMVL